MRKFFLVLVCMLGCAAAADAALVSGSGTTAATFLKIAVGPRAVAMGESYAAVADDVSSIYWNPAGLAQLETPEVSAMHVFWFQDISFDYLAGALPLNRGVAGLSLVYLNNGTLLRSNVGDTPDSPDRGTFFATDFNLSGAYALALTPSMNLGGAVKLFSENLDSQASLGWAVDAGFHYRLPWPGFTLGAVLQNLGPATRVQDAFSRLPLNFKVGAAYRPDPKWLVAMDYNQLLEQNGRISLGAEYTFEELISLRAGYSYQSAVDIMEYYEGYGNNAVAGVSAGMGVHYNALRLDYAFVPYGLLGTTHRIAVTYAWPKPATPVPTPVATPTPAPTPAPAVPHEALQQRLTDIQLLMESGQLPPISFKTGSAQLLPGSQVALAAVAKAMADFPDLKVSIEGHTDNVGGAGYNLKLSQRRVDSVRTEMIKRFGLAPDRIQAHGFGLTRPLASNRTAAGRAKNRRVEFKVLTEPTK